MKTVAISGSNSVIGSDHAANEDFFLARDDLGLYIVADGVGGYKGAETASHLVVESLEHYCSKKYRNGRSIPFVFWRAAARNAALDLYEEGERYPALRMMSTALTLLHFDDGHYSILHSGDTRAYLFRNEKLSLLTNDHTLAFQRNAVGALQEKELWAHPHQKLLTHCFAATDRIVHTDFLQGDLIEEDMFLLCSDGLVKGLDASEILRLICDTKDLTLLVDELVRTAENSTNTDDTTIIVIKPLCSVPAENGLLGWNRHPERTRHEETV